MITPPPGFELDQPEATATITPPPGFELDSPTSGMTASGLAKNAMSDIADLAMTIPNAFKKVLYDAPKDIIKSTGELGSGTPIQETTVAKDLKNFSRNAPAMGAEMIRPVVHPFEYAKEHPVNQLLNLATLATGGAGLAKDAAPAAASAAESGASTMARRALGFTKRFLNSESKISNVEDATQVALDHKIVTPGASPEVMMQRAKDLEDMAGKTIGSILENENRGAGRALSTNAAPQLREQFLFDPREAVKDIEGLRPRAKGGKVLHGGDYDAQNAVIDKAIETVQAHGDRPLPWDEANELKGRLQGLANYDVTQSKPVNDLKKALGGTFKDNLDSQLETTMQSSGRDIGPFKEAKRIYKAAGDIQNGLQNIISSKKGNNAFTLTDFLTGQIGGSAGGGTAAIFSVLAKKALEKFGPTAGASGLKKLSIVLKEAPMILGEYGPTLQKARQAGTAQFAAVNTKLLEKPDYREMMKRLEGL